jgi:hypothetical protein
MSQFGQYLAGTAATTAVPTTFRHGPIVLRRPAWTIPPAEPDLAALAAQAAAASAAAYQRHSSATTPAEPDHAALAAQAAAASAAAYAR